MILYDHMLTLTEAGVTRNRAPSAVSAVSECIEADCVSAVLGGVTSGYETY